MKPENVFCVFAFGDIIGEPGRKALFSIFYKFKNKYEPDLVILNGENAAHGFGITSQIVKQLFDGGIDVITTGNHVWQKKEVFEFIDKYPALLRPANYPPKTPGHGTYVWERNGLKAAVINIMGRIYMDPIDCPFQKVESEIERLSAEGVKIILVDFHAEATSEKQIFGWNFDGRISAIWGTHTHIQTSDERILPKKTAYITDIGMCGSIDSVIGMKIEDSRRKVIQHLPVRFSPEEGGAMEVQGAIIDINKNTGEAILISRIKERV
jgi:2',3'-cyclic-nucleotide 2'-phosphodiesterase